MQTNFDDTPWLATQGQCVHMNCFNSQYHPPSWANVGIVVGISLDRLLTSMNYKNRQMYRILVNFGDGEIASLLPCILTRIRPTQR